MCDHTQDTRSFLLREAAGSLNSVQLSNLLSVRKGAHLHQKERQSPPGLPLPTCCRPILARFNVPLGSEVIPSLVSISTSSFSRPTLVTDSSDAPALTLHFFVARALQNIGLALFCLTVP